MTSYKEKLAHIKAFVFDVDGVLTDGSVLLDDSGDMVRTMNTRDGWAMQFAIKQGYRLCVITGGNSPMVKKRLNYLGLETIYMASRDKMNDLKDFMKRYNIEAHELLYMGDDLPDYEVIRFAGVGTCPKDAASEILDVADYVSHMIGGRGCVRDVIEQTLRVQGKWFKPS